MEPQARNPWNLTCRSPSSLTRPTPSLPRSSPRSSPGAPRGAAVDPPRRVAGRDRVPADRSRADPRACSRRSACGPTRGRVPACDPVEYLTDLGYLQPGTLVVARRAPDRRWARAAAAREGGDRDLSAQQSVGRRRPAAGRRTSTPRGVPVAIGTDSLASAPTLNLFDELAELRRLAPEVSAAMLLESATRVGAEALGLRARLRDDRARQARRADRGGPARRRRERCGRISGQRRAGHDITPVRP